MFKNPLKTSSNSDAWLTVHPEPRGEGSGRLYEPNNSSVPPGGVTAAGVVGRSDPSIIDRYGLAQTRLDALEADLAAKRIVLDDAKEAAEQARGVLARTELDAREVRDTKSKASTDSMLVAQRAEVERRKTLVTTLASQVQALIAEIGIWREIQRTTRDHAHALAAAPELKLVEVKIDKPASGRWTDLVTAQQAEVTRLKAQLASVAEAPLDIETAKKAIKGQIRSLAEDGRPRITGFHSPAHGGVKLRLPMMKLPRTDGPGQNTGTRAIDIEAMAMRYWGDQILAEALAEIDEAYAEFDVEPMTAQQRHDRTRQLRAELLQAERIEAEAFWRAFEAGEDVHPRATIDPRAYLGVA